jgi:chromate transporter
LKLVAVAVVAQAVWGMARTLAPDRLRASLAIGALALTTLLGGGLDQILALAAGAGAGLILCRPEAGGAAETLPERVPRGVALASLALFVVLLVGLPILAATTGEPPILAASAFYRAGALVFGGGHVVLPLLQDQVVRPGWVPSGPFLAGYAAAQALPGPLFTFAAYLGAILKPARAGSPARSWPSPPSSCPGFCC